MLQKGKILRIFQHQMILKIRLSEFRGHKTTFRTDRFVRPQLWPNSPWSEGKILSAIDWATLSIARGIFLERKLLYPAQVLVLWWFWKRSMGFQLMNMMVIT